MTWSRDNVIAILALFATCTPIFVLVATALLHFRRQRAKKQAQADIEQPSPILCPQNLHRGPIRRESALVALILVQREVYFANC
ncbi:hypothetical protein HBI56_065850 [Parastagonospora nodorum]|nr:hypothetical protein HBH52_109640 [Parastagonospora nodorum]KAH4035841.1 hypothetical protein HBI09_092660 [Parastagonospora nodorum]KAH4068881.1 hypothetical protein HBH50_120220 [Parastagonospora nodorum]KAH4100471.1 hypothetical protein HBH48_021760 [Parastagonospora nodorum]KAH4111805.1 hypothetical protein HBH47_235190 [Parastagonospora nodorum]